MLDLPEPLPVRILAVAELKWNADFRSTQPRPFHAISFRIAGDAELRSETDRIHAVAGDVLYVPKGVAYTMRHAEEHLYVIHFDTDTPVYFSQFESFHPHNRYLFANLFRSVDAIWSGRQAGYRFEATSLLYRILSEIQKEKTSREFSSADRFYEVLSFMRLNFTDSTLSVERLSERFGTSPAYFRRFFREKEGVSPHTYLQNLRVSYAHELLSTGYYTVAEIAEKSGFSDAKYFSKVIRRAFGSPPFKLKM